MQVTACAGPGEAEHRVRVEDDAVADRAGVGNYRDEMPRRDSEDREQVGVGSPRRTSRFIGNAQWCVLRADLPGGRERTIRVSAAWCVRRFVNLSCVVAGGIRIQVD
ncbi:hypothetical protein EDD40_0030 [Saccharothrix texasensis]|uniref:Uncharacterized protein n=1 Tax=Saccharothrix texasensis TaxID=103734 RepID=A0A3N1GXJ5_9PSEU|nr:hypothetical protein EDD40_0030 [Saccharothrix texasensis]